MRVESHHLTRRAGASLRGSTGLVLVLLLTACSATPGQRRDPALAAAIDTLVELWLFADPTPGISIAVVHRGDTLAMRGYGMANVEQGTPVTDRTVFHIGSVTKAFTAAAVMKLVEEDRLRLDTTVDEVLPEYGGPGGAATIHQLLNHTSGIPSYTVPSGQLLYEPKTNAQILGTFAAEPLDFSPGTQWAYNNSGYFLLGLILERVAGTTYGEHVWETQMRPLGLEHSGHCSRPELGPDLAMGYRTRLGTAVPATPLNLRVAGADGALCSAPRDLVRWVRALAAGRVVSGDSYERMATPTRTGEAEQRRRVGSAYGSGLQLARIEGRPVVFHGGGFVGFRAALVHYPEDDLTIAVLANGPLPVFTLHRKIARLVLGLDEPHRQQGDG